MGRIRLTGSGWGREVEEDDAVLLAEKLSSGGQWGLSAKIAQNLARGGEIPLGLEEKRGLLVTLQEMRSGGGRFPTRLSQLCEDLDDDIAGYEA